jgi:hypothetical protein
MNVEIRQANRESERKRLLARVEKSAGEKEWERLRAEGVPEMDIIEDYPEVSDARAFYVRCLDALIDEMRIERETGTDYYALDRDPEAENYELCDPEEEWEE